MCKYGEKIRFCSCTREKIKYKDPNSINVNKVTQGNRKISLEEDPLLMFVWQLLRYDGEHVNTELEGEYLPPVNDIGNGLNSAWIELNLNTENCFDFDYTPIEGDNLIIRHSSIGYDYLSFIYKAGQWHIKHYNPLTNSTHLIDSGKVM